MVKQPSSNMLKKLFFIINTIFTPTKPAIPLLLNAPDTSTPPFKTSSTCIRAGPRLNPNPKLLYNFALLSHLQLHLLLLH
jgi:hypothetical protein